MDGVFVSKGSEGSGSKGRFVKHKEGGINMERKALCGTWNTLREASRVFSLEDRKEPSTTSKVFRCRLLGLGSRFDISCFAQPPVVVEMLLPLPHRYEVVFRSPCMLLLCLLQQARLLIQYLMVSLPSRLFSAALAHAISNPWQVPFSGYV